MFLHLLNMRLTDDQLTNLGLYIILGSVLLTLISLFLRILKIPNLILWSIPILVIGYMLIKNPFASFKKFAISKLFADKTAIIIIVLGIITQNIIFFNGGLIDKQKIILPLMRDSMWNIAIVSELTHSYLPQHPGMSGLLLKNNHFLYHILIATSFQITKINILYLYYRYWPVVVSLLFGISVYSVAGIFIKKYYFRCLAVFLGYFSSTLAFVLPLFFGMNFSWGSNTFFADQPFDQIGNPYTVFGFALFLFGTYTLFLVINNNDKVSLSHLVITSIILGSLYGFKSFGGIIAISGITLTTLFLSIYHRNISYLLIIIITLFMFLPVFFIITDINKTSLIFIPGWILYETFVGTDKLNLPKFASIESYYRSIGNEKGIIKIKLFEFLIYLVGNLGSRLIGMLYLLKLFISNIYSSKNNSHGLKFITIFCFISSLIAFLIPLLFNLRNSPYDIIQFTPYALIIWAIFSALALERVSHKLKNKFVVLTLCTVFLLLTIPVTVKVIMSNLRYNPDKLDFVEFQTVKYIRDNSAPDEVILINPLHFKYAKDLPLDPMYISALSERRLYLGSEGFSKQVGNNWDSRINNIDNFFSGRLGKYFLVQNHIEYIYVPISYADKIHFAKNVNLKLIPTYGKSLLYRALN